MKESTGELSMTVITIMAIILIAGILTFLVPLAAKYVNETWSNLVKNANSPTSSASSGS